MHWLILAIVILLLPVGVESYEIATHEDMVSAAGKRSIVDRLLKDDLELEKGLRTTIRGKALEDWLAGGGAREDDFPRFLNHFHNPLASDWSQAGLGGAVGQSAILWAQNPSQSAPSWSWQDARRLYLDALTKSASADRDKGLAATFEALGRQMHLIQDAASPGHARNDPHLLYNYETLIENLRVVEEGTFASWRDGTPEGVPDVGWRALDSNPLAPGAVARLVDTDRYVGTNPAVTTETLIGLAEYTNANFFSEDRIFTENDINPQKQFPFPRRSSVVEQALDVQVGGATVKRR